MHSVKPQPSIRVLSALFVALALTNVAGCDALERHPLVPSDRYDPVRGAAVATAISVAATAAQVGDLRSEAPLPSCRRRLPEGAASIATRVTVTIKRPDGSVGHWRLTQTWRRDLMGSHAVSREIGSMRPDGRLTSRRWEARQIGAETWAAIDERFADTSREPTLPARIIDLAFADVDALLTQIIVRDGRAAIASAWGICGRVQRDPTWPPLHNVGLALGERERIGWLHYENRRGRLVVEIDERWRPVAETVQPPTNLAEVNEDLTYLTVSAWIDDGVAEGWLETEAGVVDGSADAAADSRGNGTADGSAEGPAQGAERGAGQGAPQAP
ncbi:MAG: hypothetical protein ACI81R_002452 [Bradymonadia bacterium]